MDPLEDFNFSAAIQNVPHDQRWEVLKPELEYLFHSNMEYAAIARCMKTKYGFDAQVPAYKYRFNKRWAWKRSLPAKKKDQILEHAQQRALIGKRTAATFGNIAVDAKKLKRHIASTRPGVPSLLSFNRHSDQHPTILGTFLPFGIRPFAVWNMPFGGNFRTWSSSGSPTSPSNLLAKTPSDVEFQTPPSQHLSPGATSPGAGPFNAPSPFSAAVLAKASNNRTTLFLQGRFEELTRTMNQSQMRLMSNWLYQFWLFGFKTSKYWGTGCAPWNADTLDFNGFQRSHAQPSAQSPRGFLPQTVGEEDTDHASSISASPSNLCNWSIHLDEDDMYAYVDDAVNEDRSRAQPEPSIEESLKDGLNDNHFTTIPANQVPVNQLHIARAVSNSPQVLFEEALSFAIMAQNGDALINLIESRPHEEVGRALKEINAVHIATSYLNGGKACCNILDICCEHMDMGLKDAYTNDYGHTVLDNLMLTILKCHSSAPMGVIDENLRRGARHAGVEVDICGRWDADSPCFRSLVAAGEISIPAQWKHKFCNTSIQAVCHCIQVLGTHYAQTNCAPSGLFEKLCTHCGMKLQLQPLHTLIMVGFELANHACAEEDLVGVIACYLCLLSSGANPLSTADVSVAILLDEDDDPSACSHEAITPYDLLQSLSNHANKIRSRELRMGWRLLSQICERAQRGHTEMQDTIAEEEAWQQMQSVLLQFYPEECDDLCSEMSQTVGLPFGTDSALGHLWASIQAEFLNYRRIHEHDPWLSTNFNMEEIVVSLEQGDDVPNTGYVRKNLLQEYCACARFKKYLFPLRNRVSNHYYSNMDCWKRTSFIEVQTLPESWYYRK